VPKPPDLAALLPFWEVHLRAEHKSPATLKTYGDGVRGFLTWCAAVDRPAALDRPTVNAWIAHLLDRGAEPATARSRQLAVRRFSAWLTEDEAYPSDPLLGLKAPKLDTKIVEPLAEAELAALIKACRGSDLRDLRDEAIIRLMAETGARAGEVAALTVADTHWSDGGYAIVRRGKGAKGRTVPFGPQTAQAIGKYLRKARVGHRLAHTEALWLGDRGKPFTYDGLHKALRRRADLAGLQGFHPHKLRHTMADRWLAAGGSEGGLMAVAGWTRPDMLARYTKARAEARAADEARRLNLGDL
jgi:site-specific recombinase XerD